MSSGAIEPDAAQAEVAEAFAALERRLATYKPVRKQGLLGRLFADKDEGRRAASTSMARSAAARPC